MQVAITVTVTIKVQYKVRTADLLPSLLEGLLRVACVEHLHCRPRGNLLAHNGIRADEVSVRIQVSVRVSVPVRIETWSTRQWMSSQRRIAE